MTEFEQIRLADLVPTHAQISRGFPTQRATPSGDLPVMSIAALRSESAPKHFARQDDVDDLGLSAALPGDVLVAIEGGTIGETLVVADDHQPFVPSQQVATLRVVDVGRFDPWYLGAWLSTDLAAEQLRRLARGSGIQRIAMKDLPTLALSVPPIDLQHEIGERHRAFDQAIRAHRAITRCLEDLRSVDSDVTFAEASSHHADEDPAHPTLRTALTRSATTKQRHRS